MKRFVSANKGRDLSSKESSVMTVEIRSTPT